MNEEALCPCYSGGAIVGNYGAAPRSAKALRFSSMASAIAIAMATAMALAITFSLPVDNQRNNKILHPTILHPPPPPFRLTIDD